MRKRLLIAFMITAVVSVTFCSTAFAGQWVQDATRQENVNGVSNWRYRKNDGSYVKNQWAWIDRGDGVGEQYCFDEDGYMYVSKTFLLNGVEFSVNEEGKFYRDGKVVTKSSKDESSVAPTERTGEWEQDNMRPQNVNGVSNWRYKKNDGTYVINQWEWIDRGDGFGECFGFNEEGYMYVSTTVPKEKMPIKEDYYFVDSPLTVDENGRLTKHGFVAFKQMDISKNSLSQISDEEAYSRLMKLKEIYPEGMKWTNTDTVARRAWDIGGGCAAFAYITTDAVFGVSNSSVQYGWLDWDSLGVGDRIRYNNHGTDHSVVVLGIENDSITVAEGNYDGKIHWGRRISRREIESNFIFWETCYGSRSLFVE